MKFHGSSGKSCVMSVINISCQELGACCTMVLLCRRKVCNKSLWYCCAMSASVAEESTIVVWQGKASALETSWYWCWQRFGERIVWLVYYFDLQSECVERWFKAKDDEHVQENKGFSTAEDTVMERQWSVPFCLTLPLKTMSACNWNTKKKKYLTAFEQLRGT